MKVELNREFKVKTIVDEDQMMKLSEPTLPFQASPFDVIRQMKDCKEGKKVSFALNVSVKEIETGVEKQELMKIESTHKKAKKIKSNVEYKETEYTGAAFKYLSNNQFKAALLNMVANMTKEFKPTSNEA